MSLLRGIKDSKRRRATWEANNAPPPAAPPALPEVQPGPDGTSWIYGRRYSPAALAMYLRGERVAVSCGDVLVAGLDDPWVAEADARLKTRADAVANDDDAALRAEQVAKYHEQQSRPRRVARRVAGTSDWMAE